MKARDLKSLGYKLYVDKDGAAVWIKPLVKINADAAPEISAEQLDAVESGAIKKLMRAEEPAAAEPAPAAA